MNKKKQKEVEAFKALVVWSQKKFSKLPWRRGRTLYTTLVSEVMLQQTTVGTVLNHYERFLKVFPTLDSLARATELEVKLAFQGLGYYRRAVNLHKACRYLFFECRGRFPKSFSKLVEIPGIGPYTANALMAIGRDKEALCLDANLERVLARLYTFSSHKGIPLKKEIEEKYEKDKLLHQVLKLSGRAVNEALMDLGRTVCLAKKASCDECSLNAICKAHKLSRPLAYPVVNQEKSKKSRLQKLTLLRFWVTNAKGQVLLKKKRQGEWLEGQWELPTLILNSEDKKLAQYPKADSEALDQVHATFGSGITKYKVDNQVYRVSALQFREFKAKYFKDRALEYFKSEDFEQCGEHIATSVYKSKKAIEEI